MQQPPVLWPQAKKDMSAFSKGQSMASNKLAANGMNIFMWSSTGLDTLNARYNKLCSTWYTNEYLIIAVDIDNLTISGNS